MTAQYIAYKHGIHILTHRDWKYLFELDHDIFGQFHVLKHPL